MAPPRSLLVHINDVSLEAFILESIFYGELQHICLAVTCSNSNGFD